MILDPIPISFEKADWVLTKFGNKISKKAVLCGADKLSVKGKSIVEPRSVLRGDIAKVNIGQSCIVAEKVVLRSPTQLIKGATMVIPMAIGDYVVIESGSVVQAASVGTHVHIGQNCIIGPRVIISNCCKILDGTVIPPGAVLPPFSVFAGTPGVCVGVLPPSYERTIKDFCDTYFRMFATKK